MEYKYIAYTNDKKLMKGTISGVSEAAATQALITQGYQPITLEVRAGLPSIEEAFPSFFKIKPREVIMFSRQLATLLDAGISIVPAIQLIQEQTSNRMFKKVIADINNDLRAGSSLSEALSRHEDIFGDLFCQLVAAGERSGGLEQFLRRGADYLEKDLVMKKKIKKALTYPVIVLVVAVIVISVLTVFVLPKMVDMFSNMGSDLPITTRMLISLNDFIGAYKLYLFAGMGLAVFGFITYVKNPKGRLKLDRFLITAPIIGKANLMGEMARFARTLALLVHAGLPLPEVIAITRQTSGNIVVKDSLASVRTGLLQGEGLSGPMARDKTFPNLLVQMIMVGEESGKLESTLDTVATSYETEADETITNMVSLIEPVMTVVLALIVGFIALSVIMPMYSMTDAFE
ncbi:MAG: type II secretion system F family protein [Dehalococcoidia bacterium]|nr:type II secretion system F family protein [Dehalococcoidia bacterium]